MNFSFDTIKAFVLAFIAELLAYFRPLGDEMIIICMMFVVNFVCGFAADRIHNDRPFLFRKAWRCIEEALTFFAMAVFIFIFGELKGWNVGAIQSVSFMTYVLSWFYSQNVLRNLMLMFPKESTAYHVLDALYFIVSVEFVEKIPFLKNYKESLKKNDREDKATPAQGDDAPAQ